MQEASISSSNYKPKLKKNMCLYSEYITIQTGIFCHFMACRMTKAVAFNYIVLFRFGLFFLQIQTYQHLYHLVRVATDTAHTSKDVTRYTQTVMIYDNEISPPKYVLVIP